MKKPIKLTMLASLLVAMFGLSAQAAYYPNTFGNSGAVPQDGTTFSAVHTLGGMASSITSVQLVLTFNDASSLTGNGSGIQGLLTLGTTTSSPYVSFAPVATSSSGAQRIYDVTFSTTPTTGFNGLNPNGTWSLLLWDNGSSGIENGLLSWNLNITAVPEPVNVALGVFAGVFALAGGRQWWLKHHKARPTVQS
ncbi:MAG TPA: hypothetical protein VNN22_09575 [Verrucomicrobiae bacterium]|nr:hypothetical protein [Verrucomicrobiae bacterium]